MKKYIGIKKTVSEIKSIAGFSHGEYMEVFYDKASGNVWTVLQASFGENSWTEYDDENIIKVGNFSKPITQKELAAEIEKAVALQEAF